MDNPITEEGLSEQELDLLQAIRHALCCESCLGSPSPEKAMHLIHSYTEDAVREARIDELDEAFVRNAPAFADEIDIEKYWKNDYYEARLARLAQNSKELE